MSHYTKEDHFRQAVRREGERESKDVEEDVN